MDTFITTLGSVFIVGGLGLTCFCWPNKVDVARQKAQMYGWEKIESTHWESCWGFIMFMIGVLCLSSLHEHFPHILLIMMRLVLIPVAITYIYSERLKRANMKLHGWHQNVV